MAQYPNGYTSTEIISMQKDAVRRVNEMQRMARQRVAQHQPVADNKTDIPSHPPDEPDNKPNIQQNDETIQTEEVTCQPEVVGNIFTGIIDKLGLDEETIMLMLLIFLLLNEGADIMLVLALGYILL